MAVVYRAFDERLGRSVAPKVLAAPLARDEAFRRRFIRESRAAAAVDHPNIVPIYDAGEADAPGGANLAVIDVQQALHRQPALTGFLRTGSTPRRFALEPGGGRPLVVDTGSGQVQAVKIGHLT
jgi:serine/threonine protein kinase